MALHGEIRVNGQAIGGFEITRQTLLDHLPNHDEELTYLIDVHQDTTLEGNPAIHERFELSHRYGDGALALVAKALTEADTRGRAAL